MNFLKYNVLSMSRHISQLNHTLDEFNDNYFKKKIFWVVGIDKVIMNNFFKNILMGTKFEQSYLNIIPNISFNNVLF